MYTKNRRKSKHARFMPSLNHAYIFSILYKNIENIHNIHNVHTCLLLSVSYISKYIH